MTQPSASSASNSSTLHPAVALAKELCDIPSVSGHETAIADVIEAKLRAQPHLSVIRDGDAIVARTELGRDKRVLIAGHSDTVPIKDNVPARIEERNGVPVLWGRGSVDMKSGCASQLYNAMALKQPRYDVTWVFYDHEEVEDALNGLGRLIGHHPQLFDADMGIVGEPTDGQIEGGCNGTVRVIAHAYGTTAHSARAWRGDNAVYKLVDVISRVAAYEAGTCTVDGLDYRESLSVTKIGGGHALNSIPDHAQAAINYRFAPSKTEEEALGVIFSLLEGLDVELVVDDRAAGARPGMDQELVQDFCRCVIGDDWRSHVNPKYGWTDVARLSSLGIPAVNYGPGDPMLCHTDDEHCPLDQIASCAQGLERFLA